MKRYNSIRISVIVIVIICFFQTSFACSQYKLKQAEDKIRTGEYVELEIPAAYYAIINTQSLGEDWDSFLDNALTAVSSMSFNEISSQELAGCIKRRLEIPEFRNAQHGEGNEFTKHEISEIMNDCQIYVQRYDKIVTGSKGQIFIYRTPTMNDFERAKEVLLSTLVLFRLAKQGKKLTDSDNVDNVTITIRGTERFFDININSGINGKAWVGFYFR